MTVRCGHCDRIYSLPKANTENRRLTILFFAKCPFCLLLRDERSAAYPDPRCKVCNIPIQVGNLCRAHYMIIWRLHIKSRNDGSFA